jgi:predicted amino acid dehydrogenase
MDFAFLIHSRDWRDVQRKFKIAKFLPKSWVEFWCFHWPPVVVSKITGLKSQINGKEIKGWLIGIPMTARQMLENRVLAQKKIIQAIDKAEKLGAKIVGLGALTSSVTRGGLDIKDKVNISLTTGHGYTTHIVTSTALKAISFLGLDKKNLMLAIVGAAGSVGSSSAKIMAKNGIKNFIFIDVERKSDRLEILYNFLKINYPDAVFKKSHQIKDIKEADLIITATNAVEALIKPEDLKKGAVIVDDAQPSDISPNVVEERKDVLVLEGGIINTPGINNHFNFGLANKEDNYCCLGEAMILAAYNWIDRNNLGGTNLETIETLAEAGEKMGFKLGQFQNFQKKYTDKEIAEFKNII